MLLNTSLSLVVLITKTLVIGSVMSLIKADRTHSKITVGPFTQKKFLDGQGFIDYWMTEYISSTIHPLSENNVFIVAPGLLAGTSFSNPYRNNQ
jgi:aldehyde:ferredoxin oxidoreductase